MSANLLELDLTQFQGITKGDINKCINYNKGKDVAFIEEGYYDVPKRLLFLINPRNVNAHNKQKIKEFGIVSVWEKVDNNNLIKKEFLKTNQH